MTKEELEELKKDPIKFIKTLTNFKLNPYQETFLSLLYRDPQNLITCQPRNQQKHYFNSINMQRTLLLMKEKEVFKIMTGKGQATFLCIENTTEIK